ncbi:MDN1 AAA ATPase containing von Willebrand factor type A domain protein [Pyrenophora teres f. maculata]|nr:MDN1 AAA ATPase containing von Willebrand factor type A domain protein [Pyrenophora teres f. maculata]
MAAPAYTVAGLGLDMSAADAMELQSDDGGIDFTDGDIELDFEPEASHPQDDDVSLDDAASTAGEMQDEHTENDDYMVDQEDIIEEDDTNPGDDGGADIELPAVDEATTVAATQPTTTNDDDDDDELLDYTEDEEYHNPANRSPWLKTNQWVQIKDRQADEPVEQQNETSVWQQQEDRIQAQDGQAQDSTEQHQTEQQDETSAFQEHSWTQAQNGQAQDATEQQDETAFQEHDWTQAQNDQAQDITEQQEETSAEWQQESAEQQEETPTEWQQQWTQAYDEQTEDVAGQQEDVPSEWQQADWTQDQDEQAEDPDQQQDEIPADLQAMMSQSSNKKSQSPHPHNQNVEDQGSNEQEADQHEHDHEHEREHRSQSVNQNEDNQSDGGHGGVSLQGQEESANEETAHEDPAQSYHHDESAEHNESQDQEPFEMPSVTINYEDNELWLFKQHDFDNSGDWLIEDVSLAKASMSDLMRACRYSLGDDVSNEMEIGFRFDHFLNMELYEDNTACVAVSLERLVNYYHMLYANDGNNEPESFYITLLFRPRFATLLSDIAKFADQGLGYSAFDAAVAAGETHFSIGIAGTSSDELNEWDKEDGEKGDGEEQEQVQSEAQSDAHHGERDQNEGDSTQDAHEDDGVEVHETEKVPTNVASHDEHGSHREEDHEPEITISTDMPTNLSETVAQPERERSRSAAPTEAELEARRLQEEDDLIDYSDEEDEVPAPVKEVEQAPATQLSPSSTTVQGDESANTHGQESGADSPRLNEQTSQDQDKIDFDTVEEPPVETEHGEAEGDNGDEPSYEDFVKAFEADDSYPEFDVDEPGDDGADVEYDGDANQAYADYDQYQDPDQEPEQGLMNGDGSVLEFDYSGNTTVDHNDFTNADDFLDLDNGAEWAAYEESGQGYAELATIGQDNAGTVDEEDGVAGKTGSASAAEPQTASSMDANEVSPQGQKRTIDEAGHGADAATNATDVKRPRV